MTYPAEAQIAREISVHEIRGQRTALSRAQSRSGVVGRRRRRSPSEIEYEGLHQRNGGVAGPDARRLSGRGLHGRGKSRRLGRHLDDDALDASRQPHHRSPEDLPTASIRVTAAPKQLGQGRRRNTCFADKLAEDVFKPAKVEATGPVDRISCRRSSCAHPLAACGRLYFRCAAGRRPRHRRRTNGLHAYGARPRPRRTSNCGWRPAASPNARSRRASL